MTADIEPADLAATVEELASRVQTLEDVNQIRALLIAYGTHADTQDIDALVALFTDDAVLEVWPLPDDGHVDLRPERYEGHAGLREFVEAGRRRLPATFFGSSVHLSDLSASPQISDGTASADTLIVTMVGPSADRAQPTLSGISRNRWTFVKSNGVWRIATCVRRRVGRQFERVS